MVAKTNRKISLYNGDELAYKIAVNSLTSNREVLRIMDSEMMRMPLITHALVRDAGDKQWYFERHSSWWQRLKFMLLAR